MIKDTNIIYISAFGLLVRMFIFFVFYTHVTIYPDSSGYIDLAQHISALSYSGYDGARTPGYALIIALSFGNLYGTVFYQFLFGILTAVLWYLLLQNLRFSKKQSLYITMFLQTFIHIYFFETAILMETFVLLLITLAFYLITLNKQTFAMHVILGLLFGYLVLTKPFYLYIPFLLYGFWFLQEPKNFKLLASRFIILVFPVLAYLGWSSVVEKHHGYFSSTTLMGVYISQNCVRFAEKSPDEFKWLSEPYVAYRDQAILENKDIAMSIWYAYDDGAYDKYHMEFSELSKALTEYAKVTIANNPMEYLHQVVFYSWRDFWNPTLYWNYNDFNFKYANKLFRGIWYIQEPIIYLFRIVFLLLVPVLIIKAIKNRTIDIGFIIMSVIFIASILQALLTYGTNNRFSFPFEFLIIISVLLYFKESDWWFLKPLINKFKF
ncbi:glycosyltransferase family 39 protein [Bizionia sp. M204]|uniref:glycosyltransferase family 39 protein n=1 Tax=Bizionia sp. M204 TaxID=2675331 RepID=UPI002059FCC5|nr:glycosyltransferase family 39 protein [Bizionia sp. M204]UPS91836.1 hypothetical protein GMA17_08955 [Bizionia sp. M204]